MIGLVLVSHSRPLAQSLALLVQQVASQDAPIAIAAGAGPDHTEFGTDAIEIMEAIQSVYSSDGVLILMDLGSAVLSAQMAVDLLPEEMQSNIQFCSAPLIEGSIAAAVQAGLGSDLNTACQEAQMALMPKREQLGEQDLVMPGVPASGVELDFAEADARCAVLTLHNTYGLHARPAARFVQLAGRFEAQIQVRNLTKQKGPVTAKSLNALATLGAVQNNEIEICAVGRQADQAVQALSGLVIENFGESTEPPPIATAQPQPVGQSTEGAFSGVPISEGYAIAGLVHYEAPPPPIPQTPAKAPEIEWDQLQQAIQTVHGSIAAHRKQIALSLGEDQASIFDAHLLILDDPEILEDTHIKLFENGMNAASGWNACIENTVSQYTALDDPYLKQRAADVRDVGNQVLFALSGDTEQAAIQFDQSVILAAEELTPTQTSQLDLEHIQGIITVLGGPTSHSAILARSLGIPAISGVPPTVLRLPDGTPTAIDGNTGALWIEPSQEISDSLSQKRTIWLQERDELLQKSRQPGITADGQRVEIAANAGNIMDAEAAIANGAEGIGLLRTEFLFLTRQTPPTEQEQADALAAIAQTMGELPVIVRTLDVGGDKPLPYIDLPEEANPFLGVRAIRLSFQRPDLFKTQLRALLRAGAETNNLRVMFPMISGWLEVQKAQKMLEEAHQELVDQDIAHQWPIETGIMVEIPSAAVQSFALAQIVDFFSIGTNDLTQYTLAAERGNANLADYADALEPSVLNLIKQVTTAAHQHGKWVGVCGELAGDPQAVPILVGLGVDELSMSPGSIPRAKDVLRSFTIPDAQELAQQALSALTKDDVRRLAASFLARLS